MDLFDKVASLPAQHDQMLEAGQDPFGVCMDDMVSATEAVVAGRNIVLAGTNNYLGLTYDPACIAAGQEAMERHGTGTTGSRIANGTYAEHRKLENDIAAFFGFGSAMVFPTGYQANLGVISALAGPDVVWLHHSFESLKPTSTHHHNRMTRMTALQPAGSRPATAGGRQRRLPMPRGGSTRERQ